MSGRANSHVVVAIDGPAASGKSSVARTIARRLAFVHVNTGAMYRAATWFALDRGIPVDDCEALTNALDAEGLVADIHEGKARFLIGSTEASDVATLPEVARNVSQVAKCPGVRHLLVGVQRRYASFGNVVVEGRDIGSVVFPETPWKYFIDASVEVRQERRAAQGLSDSISDRDRLDSTRAISPLVQAADALRIDSTHLSLEEVVRTIHDDLLRRGLETSHSAT